MTSELDKYKQNRINEYVNIFNTSMRKLYYTTVSKINAVRRSRQRHIVKRDQINNLVNLYYVNYNTLSYEFNNSLETIKNYVPKTLTINKNKKALLIGINYTGSQYELNGCVNDVNSIKDKIINDGFNDITVLAEEKATKNNILKEITNLLINSQEGDLLFLSYSGHGSYDLDKNGDEKTGYDQLIVPYDFNMIVDDELKTIIQTHLKPNVTLFSMFDSCFSGSVLDLKYQYMDSLDYDKYTENNKQLETKGNVFMISGCNDYQTSADAFINNKYSGAMTWSLLEALKQKPECSWRELVVNMRDLLKTSRFTQIPQFSCGTFENIDASVFI